MGMPMVERLVAAGHRVRVHVRRAEVREAAVAAGADAVSTGREAADSSELVVACLFSDDQLLDSCSGPDGVVAGLAAGAVVASHVTGTRRTLFRLSEAVEARGGRVVDAPVSGTADDIRAGRLSVLLGGARADVELCAGVMAAYADDVLPVGDLGTALAVKLVNNLLFAAHSQLAVAAVELGAELHLDRQTLLGALGACSGASYAVSTLHGLPDVETFARLAGPFLRKDVAACEAELADTGCEAPLLMEVAARGPLLLTSQR
jgi:3-hydroxyisobutyrate dehydrogenase-like beta-hydroxyacid dehydrogenase